MSSPGPVESAVSNFVAAGLYPEDEDIITAQLPSATLKSLGSLLDRARSDVKTSIRELSRISAPDIDGWIEQAKQLKRDIDGSVKQSDNILELGQENIALQEQTTDAKGKVNFLKSEVSFNQTLVDILSSIRKGKNILEQSAEALGKDAIPNAVIGLTAAREQLSSLGAFQTTTVAGILGENISEVQKKLLQSLDAHWQRLVVIDTITTTITIQETSGKSNFEDVVAALIELDLLKPKVLALWKAIDSLLLGPRLARQDGKSFCFSIRGSSISLGPSSDRSIKSLFTDIAALRAFFKNYLPSRLETELSSIMMPSLLSRLTSGPLPAAVPADLGGIPVFTETLQQVTIFAEALQQSGWHHTNDLSNWVASAPEVWLQGRRADSLNSMRQLLQRGLGNPRSVERVETQTIVDTDEMFGAPDAGPEEDWDAAWNEDQADDVVPSTTQPTEPPAEEEDEDPSAWGWDEETAAQQPQGPNDVPDEDDGAEAWGWEEGDEDKPDSPVRARHPLPESSVRERQAVPANGHRQRPTERTVTLRESYFITAIPESILELIIMIVEDADNLSRSAGNPVAPAAKGLYSLAALLLAMYRASVPEAYSVHESGNMFVYNDSQYLCEQLRLFADHHASQGSASTPSLSLHADISTLEGFGKRAYSLEMESQKTILRDQLDDAQGFSNCTQQPQARQCDLAVAQVIDRIRLVNSQWKNVLSPSALLQSTGSLMSTVVNKIILDILDMSDIQESESQALTKYCSSLESLEDLFLPANQEAAPDGGEAPVPLTAGYVPNWLRFQYLANILDSSLVDIKYLWTEGSLALEFKPEEVVDLIEALFADSPRRREAINEIRRPSR